MLGGYTWRLVLALVAGLLLLLGGCSRQAPAMSTGGGRPALPPLSPQAVTTLDQVREITARYFCGRELSSVKPTTSLADLDGDELDIFELAMEFEERYGVHFTDEAFERRTGGKEGPEALRLVTMSRLARMVDELKQQASSTK
jgi:acyl carrier protein